MIKDTRGFTAVELLVAMTLTGLIVGVSYKSYFFFQQNFVRWQERVSLEEAARRVMIAVPNDIQTLRRILQAEDQSMTFVNQNRDIISYRLHKRNIFKNERPLLNKGFFVKKLQFTYFVSNGRWIEYDGDVADIERIKVQLVLEDKRKTSFGLTTEITLRNKRLF